MKSINLIKIFQYINNIIISNIIDVGEYFIRVGLEWHDETLYDSMNDSLKVTVFTPNKILLHTIHTHALLAIISKFEIIHIEGVSWNIL